MIYPHNQILFSHKRKKVCEDSKDEPWKHYLTFLKSQTKGPHIVWFQLHEMFRIGKSTETGSRLVVAGAGRTKWGYGASFWKKKCYGWKCYEVMKMLQNYIVVMVALLCEYTKNHSTVYFKRMNFMLCELYLNFFKWQS